jgi:addiction module RelB/DinJ family antitoxin
MPGRRGQRVLVRVLEVDRSDCGRFQVSVSVKQAGENPCEKALKKYALGIPVSNAINMFYKQIILQRGIPFEMKLPQDSKKSRVVRRWTW